MANTQLQIFALAFILAICASTTAARASVALEAGYRSSLHAPNDPEKSEEATLAIIPSMKIGTNTLSLSASMTRDLQGLEETRAEDTAVVLAIAPLVLNERTKVGLSVSTVVPTNEENRKRNFFRGATGIKSVLTYTPVGFLNLKPGASFRQNVHEFTQNADGVMNIQNTTRGILAAEVLFGEKVALYVEGDFLTGRTYGGTAKEKFEIFEEITVDLGSNMSAMLGHSNGGSAFKSNGAESNLSLFNDQSSTVYGSLGIVF